MKMAFILFTAYLAMKSGIFIADFSRDYFDNFIDKKVNEKIAEFKTKGKPAYCSFYQ